jgi:hypothetical protein
MTKFGKATLAGAIDVTVAKVVASPSRPPGVGRDDTQMDITCVPLNDDELAAIEVPVRLRCGPARRS